jgi:hypothetical protein
VARPNKTDMNLDWFYEIYDYVYEQKYATRAEFCTLYLGKTESFIRLVKLGKNYVSADTASYLAEALRYKAQYVYDVEASILNKYADRCYDYIRDKAQVEFKPNMFKEIA